MNLLHTSNSNGKLLCDSFADFRPWNDLWCKGDLFEIHYNDLNLGTARLVAAKRFKLINLNDYMSEVVYGHNHRYALSVIKRLNPAATINDLYGMFFFKWETRNREETHHMIELREKKILRHLKKAS